MPKKIPRPRMSAQDEVENWTLSEEALNSILKDCNVSLPQEAQWQLRSYLWSHISVVKDEMAAPEAGPIFVEADRIIRCCEELTSALRRIEDDADINAEVLRDALRRAKFGALPLDRATSILIQLRDCFEKAREDLERRSYGEKKSGPRERPNLQALIWYLSYVYEQAGRKPTANFSPSAKMPNERSGGRNTPFVRFVHALIQHLPLELRVELGPLGEIANRALKAKPKGWSPY